jgi:hypothetical protein
MLQQQTWQQSWAKPTDVNAAQSKIPKTKFFMTFSLDKASFKSGPWPGQRPVSR